MDRETIRDYLTKADMEAQQAEALSNIFAQLATKNDIALLEQRFERIDDRFENVELRFDAKLATLKADLTWRMIAVVGFFGTVITLLNAYIG